MGSSASAEPFYYEVCMEEEKKRAVSFSMGLSVGEIAIIIVVLVVLYLIVDGNVSFQLLHPNS